MNRYEYEIEKNYQAENGYETEEGYEESDLSKRLRDAAARKENA